MYSRRSKSNGKTEIICRAQTITVKGFRSQFGYQRHMTKRGATKKAEARQKKAVRHLFFELVGVKPTEEQIDAVID
jgi:hypothetical protein